MRNSSETLQLGGSARPFQYEFLNENNISIIIQEGYTNIEGYNHSYFSELFFVRI